LHILPKYGKKRWVLSHTAGGYPARSSFCSRREPSGGGAHDTVGGSDASQPSWLGDFRDFYGYMDPYKQKEIAAHASSSSGYF